jgi:membrane protease YdiL (CAAX protease family)
VQRICGPAWLVVTNTLAFAAWHMVAIAAGTLQASSLISAVVIGLVCSIARWYGKNTGLPALLHFSVDIAGM